MAKRKNTRKGVNAPKNKILRIHPKPDYWTNEHLAAVRKAKSRVKQELGGISYRKLSRTLSVLHAHGHKIDFAGVQGPTPYSFCKAIFCGKYHFKVWLNWWLPQMTPEQLAQSLVWFLSDTDWKRLLKLRNQEGQVMTNLPILNLPDETFQSILWAGEHGLALGDWQNWEQALQIAQLNPHELGLARKLLSIETAKKGRKQRYNAVQPATLLAEVAEYQNGSKDCMDLLSDCSTSEAWYIWFGGIPKQDGAMGIDRDHVPALAECPLDDISPREWDNLTQLVKMGLTIPSWLLVKGFCATDGMEWVLTKATLALIQAEVDDALIHPQLLRSRAEALHTGAADREQLLPHLNAAEAWLMYHNQNVRSSQDEVVVRVRESALSREMVLALSQGKRMRFMLRLVRTHDLTAEHDIEAAARVVLWFGDRSEAFIKRTKRSVHDAGINLPTDEFSADKTDFLWRYAHKVDQAIRVVNLWEVMFEHGLNPLTKDGMAEAEKILLKVKYRYAKDLDFAAIAAECGVVEARYEPIETRWLEAMLKLNYQTVPAPLGIEDEELRLVQLAKDDPRTLFAGSLTSCCQHPQGAAASCAWHSVESEHGAIWAVFKDDKMLTQGWVWRPLDKNGDLKDVLVIDNVEMHISARPNAYDIRGESEEIERRKAQAERIVKLYVEAAEQVLGKLGIYQVYAGMYRGGMGYDEIRLNIGKSIANPFQIPTSYTDARSVWLLAEGEKPKQAKRPRMKRTA